MGFLRSSAGKAFLDMLGVFAEFETNLRKERQAEGIAKAKAAGVYKGRPPSIDFAKVRELKKKGLGASQIAKALKIGRASVYRAL
ncbi:MAG TPA: helix-turn-helix domain-containing protein [Candidatus Sulfotelmatobacter sp.]